MQLYADSSSESSDDNNNSDLHVLVLEPGNMFEEADVIMTEVDAPCAKADKSLEPPKSGPSSVGPVVSHLSVDTSIGLSEAIESSVGSPGFSSDYTALSPSDITLLDGPDPKTSDPSIRIPKVEENPFSPDPIEMNAEMFPLLPSPADPVVPQTTAPLPHGPVRINGIYYQPVPLPHNVVVMTPSVPDPILVTVSPSKAPAPVDLAPSVEKPKVGLEFTMPEQLPVKKTSRSSCTRSRSSSRTRSRPNRSNSRDSQIGNQPPLSRSSRGRSNKKMPTTPIHVPASHSHLLAKAKPKKGLKITFSTDTQERRAEAIVQHLARLATEASAPLIVTPKPSTETSVPPEPLINAQEDSDVDLETGEISVPTPPVNKSAALIYKPNATIEDFKAFVAVMMQRESAIWDRDIVSLHPDLF